jgi:hypothetical protein
MQKIKAEPLDQLIEKELEQKDIRLQLVLGIFRGIISVKDSHGGCHTTPAPLGQFAKKSR